MTRFSSFFMYVLFFFIQIISLAQPISATIEYSPKTIPLSSPLYEEVDMLYRLHGIALPSGARPWSTAEAALILNEIPDEGPTQNLKRQALSRLEQVLPRIGSNGLSYTYHPTIAIETYSHLNTTDFIVPKDWIHHADKRLPLVDLRLELQWEKTFYFSSSIEIGTGDVSSEDTIEVITSDYPEGIGAIVDFENTTATYQKLARLYQKTFNTNLLTFNKEFQADWPRNSQMTLGGTWWNLSLGRGQLNWGVGKSGNLIIDDHIKSHNSLKLDLFSKEFKLQFLYIFMPNPLEEEKQSIFMGHRIEMLPFSYLRIAVTENVMFKGESLPLNYLDPTYIYHNLYNRDMLNAIASLELNIAPYPGLSLYSQFAIDQFRLSNETDSEANALGTLIGIEYSRLLKTGVFSVSFERVNTDPTLYRRDKIDFLVLRGLRNNGKPLTFDYLGYQWGSDSIVYQFDMSYALPGSYRIGMNVMFHQQGEVTIYGTHSTEKTNTGYANIKQQAPSRDVLKETLIIGCKGEWYVSSYPVHFFAQLNRIARWSKVRSTGVYEPTQTDLQLVTAMVFKL